jgi:hypothetical protein
MLEEGPLPGRSTRVSDPRCRRMMSTEKTDKAESPGRVSGALRWMFVSRHSGRLVVAQWPNVPLAAFLLLFVVSRIFHPSGSMGTFIRVLGIAALLVWALDELLRGVNPFRRILGAAVLLATVSNLALH